MMARLLLNDKRINDVPSPRTYQGTRLISDYTKSKNITLQLLLLLLLLHPILFCRVDVPDVIFCLVSFVLSRLVAKFFVLSCLKVFVLFCLLSS